MYFVGGGGAVPRGHSGTLLYTCVNKKKKRGGLFQPRTRKAGNAFRGVKCHFSGKRGGFVNTDHSDSKPI